MKSKLLPPLWLITCFVFALVGYLVYQLQDLARLLLIGFIAAYTIEPIVSWLEKFGIRRVLAFFLIAFILFFGLFTILATAVPIIMGDFNVLVSHLPTYIAQAREKLEILALDYPRLKLNLIIDKLSSLTESLVSEVVPFFVSFLSGSYSLGLTLVNLFLLPFIVYYLVIDFKKLKSGFLSLLPQSKSEKVDEVLSEINVYINSFVSGQIIVAFILFCLYAIALYSIDLDLWLLLALISGFGHLIPYMGFIVGISLSSLIALVQFTSFMPVLLIWGIYGVVQFIEGSLLSPKIIGDKTGLNPLSVILGLVAGGTLFGLLGILLAIPFLTTLKVLLKYFHVWFVNNIEMNPGEKE